MTASAAHCSSRARTARNSCSPVLFAGTTQGEPFGAEGSERERIACAGDPLRPQRAAVEFVDERRVSRWHPVAPLVEDRPVVLPANGGEERLASVHVELRCEPARPHTEVHRRPLPGWQLDEVRVAGVLDRVRGAAVREDRVRRIAFVRPGDGSRPRHRNRVAARGSALRDQQVPPAVAPVDVRGLRRREPGSAPEAPRLGQQDAGRGVDAGLHDDRGVAERAPRQVARAVGVPREIGIDAERARGEDGFAPRPGGILGRHDQLPLGHLRLICRDQPEAAVVMTQSRGEDPPLSIALRRSS